MLDPLLQLHNTIQRDAGNTTLHGYIEMHYGCNSLHRTLTRPTLIVVVKGEASIIIGSQICMVKVGDMLVLPPTELGLTQSANINEQSFLWIAVHFTTDTLRYFKKTHGESLGVQKAPFKWHAAAPKSVIGSILQWLIWNASYPSSLRHIQHRQSELLLLLTEAGLAFNILFDEQSNWCPRVHQLLSMDPKRRWYMRDVCRQLGVSEATLRRRLSVEKTNFRQILEEVRLQAGLILLRKTNMHIGRISEDVGYESQSRFGERFKQYFGVTPSELRRTQGSQQLAHKY